MVVTPDQDIQLATTQADALNGTIHPRSPRAAPARRTPSSAMRSTQRTMNWSSQTISLRPASRSHMKWATAKPSAV